MDTTTLGSQLDLIQLMQAFNSAGTLAIAGAGVFFAYQQFRISREHLRHDLFQRRMSVFEAAQTFLEEVVWLDETEPKRHARFNLGRSSARFIFGAEVNRHLEEISKRAVNIRAIKRKLDSDPPENSRASFLKQLGEEDQWMANSLKGLPDLFSRYLSFGSEL